jgi:rod shape-determining protein MreC
VARTRRPRRPRLTIGLLVLASITIITLDYRGESHGAITRVKSAADDAFSPVQHGVDDVTRPIGSFLAGAFNGGELQEENNKLREENGELRREALAAQATRNALASLEQLVHLPWTQNIATVTAQVIAENPSNFAATVELDVGTANGVDPGMPVVAGAGLIGSVLASSSTTSTVQLITDGASQVGVTFGSSSGNEAQVDGTGIGKPLSVSFVYPGTTIHKGEVLTTSALPDLAYPPLIPVAQIRRFSSSASASEESVTADPVVNLSSLSYVDVLQWQPTL